MKNVKIVQKQCLKCKTIFIDYKRRKTYCPKCNEFNEIIQFNL